MTLHRGYLLDTNVVSEMMRVHPDPQVEAFLGTLQCQDVGVASITAWEIFNGIVQLSSGSRRTALEFRFRSLLEEALDGRVFDWTMEDAIACAQVMERKRRTGEPLDDHLPDAMIAGTAVRLGFAVVTRNVVHFRNTGIAVVNPWINALTIQQRPFDAPEDR